MRATSQFVVVKDEGLEGSSTAAQASWLRLGPNRASNSNHHCEKDSSDPDTTIVNRSTCGYGYLYIAAGPLGLGLSANPLRFELKGILTKRVLLPIKAHTEGTDRKDGTPLGIVRAPNLVKTYAK